MGSEVTAIDKLDYIYKYINNNEGDEETALNYLKELGKAIDLVSATGACGGGETIPRP